nr:hypothetical protein [Tanacetum cinerariifolium]
MTGNRALLTNFVEKFLGTVYFGNNDFAMIAAYGDVVIGSMTIKKVYCVESLGHNLFSIEQFYDKGLEVTFRKSTCFVRTEDGVDLLTGDRSSNLYTITLNEVASNSLACHLAKASSSEDSLKTSQVQNGFASNKPLYLLHIDLCGLMRVESINGKRYVLVVVDDYSRYTWLIRTDNGTEFKNKTLAKFFDEVGITQKFSAARTPQQNGVVERRNRTLVEAARTMLTFANLPLFLWAEAIATTSLKEKGDIGVFVGYSKESASFRIYNKRTRKIHKSVSVNFDEIPKMASKQFSLEPGLSNLNEKGKSSNPTVSQVSEPSKKDLEDLFQKFYNEYFDSSKIMKSLTMNVKTSNVEIPSHEEEVFHESSESFQGESSSSSLNDYVQQSPEEVILP